MAKQKLEDIEKLEELIRSMIAREDDLVNHRMGWLATFNGLLFAALGFCWDKPTASQFLMLICIVGLLISCFHAFGIFEVGRAQRRLLIWWRDKEPKTHDSPGIMGIKPVGKNYFLMLLNPWFLTALTFTISWLVTFIYLLKHAGEI